MNIQIEHMTKKLSRGVRLRKLSMVALSSLIFLFVGELAQAERKSVDETQKASAEGRVKITVERGELEVIGWDKNQISVSGKLDEKTREFIFEVDGDDAIIAVKIPNNHRGWGRERASDLVVYVPERSEVDIGSVSTDIRLKNLLGGVELGTVSGDVTATKLLGRISLTSVSGEMDLRNAEGRIVAKSVSGDIDARNIKGEHKLNSVSGELLVRDGEGEFEVGAVSGDIELSDITFSQLDGGTVSGDIDVEAIMLPGGNSDLESVSGSIRVEFLEQVDARFDLETASGSIVNRVTDDRPKKSKYIRDEVLHFQAKEGKGEVTLSSRSGDIVVSQ